jgi:hypothetical protein
LVPLEAAAVAEQKCGEPVTRAQQIDANVFAAAEQVTGGFLLVCRNVNRGQGLSSIEQREMARISAVRLDPIPRAGGNQGRGDDVARNASPAEGALELTAARTRS